MFVLLSPSTVPVPFPLPPSKESIIPKDVNFLVGYEAGHRLTEPERRGVRFARVEQLEQWFLASAPGNPVLLRSLEILKEKFLWKIQDTVELTGPATFSDAVHEFLAQAEADGVQMEVSDRVNASEERRSLSFPSERAYSVGSWKLYLLASGRERHVVQQLVATLSRKDLVCDCRDRTVLVTALGKCSLWPQALQLVAHPPHLVDVILMGALVTACGRGRAWAQSLECLQWIQDLGLELGLFTLNAAANACVSAHAWAMALHLLDLDNRDDLRPNTVSCNIMLSACDKGGQLQVRHSLLRSMEDAQQAPSLITLNTLIDLCEAAADWALALKLLDAWPI
eukprot:g2261.t1